MRTSLLILALALFAEGAYPISRIGNNDDVPGLNGELQDSVEGFVAAVPADFPDVLSISDRSAKLSPPDAMAIEGFEGGGPDRLAMMAYPLGTSNPEWLNKSDVELIDFLTKTDHFVVTEIRKDPCGFFLFGENAQGFIGVGKWGVHGYVLSAQQSASQVGKQGIIDILNSTKITESCSQ